MLYEFNNYPYYALIRAKSEEEAISCYNEQVCELEEEDKELCPDSLTKEKVIEKIKSSNFDCECNREKAVKELDVEMSEPEIILIDSSLI